MYWWKQWPNGPQARLLRRRAGAQTGGQLMARTVPLSDHTHPRDPVTRCSVCDWNEARIVALEAALREIAEMDQPDPLYSAVRIAERALAQEARSEWARAP